MRGFMFLLLTSWSKWLNLVRARDQLQTWTIHKEIKNTFFWNFLCQKDLAQGEKIGPDQSHTELIFRDRTPRLDTSIYRFPQKPSPSEVSRNCNKHNVSHFNPLRSSGRRRGTLILMTPVRFRRTQSTLFDSNGSLSAPRPKSRSSAQTDIATRQIQKELRSREIKHLYNPDCPINQLICWF